MKIASFELDRAVAFGIVRGKDLVVASDALRNRYPDLRSLLELDALNELAIDTKGRDQDFEIDKLQLLPPVHNARRVICVGINYPKRYPLKDTPAPPPEHIILFSKLEGTLVGHGESLEMPRGAAAETFDYEGEIALIIGKGGRHINAHQAFDHIAGYTAMNDGSVRDWQKHSVHAGKNFANSGACGPWMVTADEITEVESMRLSTRLNGEIVQDTTVAEMIFSIPELIAYISHTIDLRPGDVIATGSPEGSGGSRQPQRFLRAGDRLDIEVSGVGVLHNQVSIDPES